MVVNTNVVTNITVPKLAVAIAVPLVVIIALIALCFGCYVCRKRSKEPSKIEVVQVIDSEANRGGNNAVDPNAH